MTAKVKRRPKVFFLPEEEHIWGPKLYEDGRLRLPLKTIAWGVGCSLNLLATNEDALFWVHQGWYEHDSEVEKLLLDTMRDDPLAYGFEDRAQIRAMKLDAAKHRMKLSVNKDDKLELMDELKKQTKALEDLSDEELKAKAKAYLDRKNG
jgi:hypothetical protein